MGYKDFTAAIYFTISDLDRVEDLKMLEEKFTYLEKHISCRKVYLETYRGSRLIDREKILKIKEFFQKKGIAVSGGITTARLSGWDFKSFCYTNPKDREELKYILQFTAELFDEIIFDDFYFYNCKCESCIKAKGEKTWSQFRTDLMKQISEEIVVKTAKKVNPNVNLIIKYPNWYDDYQSTGYNLEDESQIFDMVYTGTETRNPRYTQQNLQRYTSYFLLRYLENVKPGKNGGGWFDTFDCHYNLGSYVEQAYLTLFAKAREVTLFCAGLLFTRGSIFVPLAGYVFEELDRFLSELGQPVGVSCYKPYHSKGENYIHGYLGMLGIPLEPFPEFPTQSDIVFLTESAAQDEELPEKIKQILTNGKKVIITSGLLKALQDRGIEETAEIKYTDKKVAVKEFAYPMFECSFGNYYEAKKEILIPQIEFSTNDCRQIIVGFSENKNFPVLLEAIYGKGSLYVLTIPDNFGDLYNLPEPVLNKIREIFTNDLPVEIEGPANVGLFVYDNNTFIIESFLPYNTDVKIKIKKPGVT